MLFCVILKLVEKLLELIHCIKFMRLHSMTFFRSPTTNSSNLREKRSFIHFFSRWDNVATSILVLFRINTYTSKFNSFSLLLIM